MLCSRLATDRHIAQLHLYSFPWPIDQTSGTLPMTHEISRGRLQRSRWFICGADAYSPPSPPSPPSPSSDLTLATIRSRRREMMKVARCWVISEHSFVNVVRRPEQTIRHGTVCAHFCCHAVKRGEYMWKSANSSLWLFRSVIVMVSWPFLPDLSRATRSKCERDRRDCSSWEQRSSPSFHRNLSISADQSLSSQC